MHGAVVVHVDLDAGLLDDAANHLAAWSDDVTDLIGRNVNGVNARRVLRHVGARLGDGLLHFADDKEAAAAGLPLVSTPASGGVVDLLTGRPGAWLATEVSASALTNALENALEDLLSAAEFHDLKLSTGYFSNAHFIS